MAQLPYLDLNLLTPKATISVELCTLPSADVTCTVFRMVEYSAAATGITPVSLLVVKFCLFGGISTTKNFVMLTTDYRKVVLYLCCLSLNLSL